MWILLANVFAQGLQRKADNIFNYAWNCYFFSKSVEIILVRFFDFRMLHAWIETFWKEVLKAANVHFRTCTDSTYFLSDWDVDALSKSRIAPNYSAASEHLSQALIKLDYFPMLSILYLRRRNTTICSWFESLKVFSDLSYNTR